METNNLVTRITDLDSKDRYSHSEPDLIRVKHLDLDLAVLFDQRVLAGTVDLTFDRWFSGDLVLDTRNLIIHSAAYSIDRRDFHQARVLFEGYEPTLCAAPRLSFAPHHRVFPLPYFPTPCESRSPMARPPPKP